MSFALTYLLSSISLASILLVSMSILRSSLGRFRKAPSASPIGTFPGPRGWPLIGNLFDMPFKHAWLTFSDWKSRYGSDLVKITVLGQDIIILNSRKAVEDLLYDRSAIYSDRPPLTLMRKWANFDWALFAMPYSDEMHLQRKLMIQCIGPTGCQQYNHTMHCNAIEFAKNLLETPKEFMSNIKLHVATNLQRLAYGRIVTGPNDPFVDLIKEMTHQVDTLGAMGSHIVDQFPTLSALPKPFFGLKFARTLDKIHWIVENVLQVPWKDAKRRIDDGTILRPCIVDSLLEDGDQVTAGLHCKNLERSQQAVATVTYTAGFELTASTLITFFLTMSTFPEAQANAQAAIDDLLGGDRLPDHRDIGGLPYVQAIFLEVMRWGTAAPLSAPHRAMRGDVYRGVRIKQGTTLIPNTWGCLHDATDFPEPMKFKPERFLTPDGTKLLDKFIDPRDFAFGYGRRVCPGRWLAESFLWISFVTVLATFNVSKALDEQGNEIIPDLNFDSGQAASYPKPFSVRITPRSEEAIELLRNTIS